MPGTHGWAEVDAERKRELIAAIRSGSQTKGPSHIELDLTDRCNVSCYFCNQQDLRTKESIPLSKLVALVDELATTGLRSVRLSGGGDPLFHRDIVPLLDHLALRGIVVDNLTTNGAALNEEVARRLVSGKAREVVVSLNAADAGDYARMLRVSEKIFDAVIRNVRGLVATRSGQSHPFIVLQFLLDQDNAGRIEDMYELGASLGVDRIAINAVLSIPNERIDDAQLLAPEHWDRIEPGLERIFRKDFQKGLLNVDFPMAALSQKVQALRDRLGMPPRNFFPLAPSFTMENSGCFFAWYSAAVTGNGDIRPCCFMLSPSVKPLGNIHEGTSFAHHWQGQTFQTMRAEMREVLVSGSSGEYSPDKYQILQRQCVEPGLCWLKNMFFRGDEDFYRELGKALHEIRNPPPPRKLDHVKKRVAGAVASRPLLRSLYDRLREGSRPMRARIKRTLGWDLTDAT